MGVVSIYHERRLSFGAAVVGGKIFVVGYVNLVEMFDNTSWSIVSQRPTHRFGCTAVSFGGKLVVLGGDCDEIEVYDPATTTWSNLPTIRAPFYMALIAISF